MSSMEDLAEQPVSAPNPKEEVHEKTGSTAACLRAIRESGVRTRPSRRFRNPSSGRSCPYAATYTAPRPPEGHGTQVTDDNSRRRSSKTASALSARRRETGKSSACSRREEENMLNHVPGGAYQSRDVADIEDHVSVMGPLPPSCMQRRDAPPRSRRRARAMTRFDSRAEKPVLRGRARPRASPGVSDRPNGATHVRVCVHQPRDCAPRAGGRWAGWQDGA